MELSRVTHCVFSGGGIKGFSFYGVLRALECALDQQGESYHNFVSGLKTAIGTSIGALFALLVVLELEARALDFVFAPNGAIATQFLPTPTCSAFSNYGLDTGVGLAALVTQLLAQRHLSPDISMGSLYKCTRKRLVVVVYDVLEMRPVYLDHENAAEMPVVEAVAASMRIPLVYTPLTTSSKAVYSDGASGNNFAMNLLLHVPPEHVLGFRCTTQAGIEMAQSHPLVMLGLTMMHVLHRIDELEFEGLPETHQQRVVTVSTALTGLELYASQSSFGVAALLGAFRMWETLNSPECVTLRWVVTWTYALIACHLHGFYLQRLHAGMLRYIRQRYLRECDDKAPAEAAGMAANAVQGTDAKSRGGHEGTGGNHSFAVFRSCT
jgi:predicted acylesterase/phospholipase RssA